MFIIRITVCLHIHYYFTTIFLIIKNMLPARFVEGNQNEKNCPGEK